MILAEKNRTKSLCKSGGFCITFTTTNEAAAISFVFPSWIINDITCIYKVYSSSKELKGNFSRNTSAVRAKDLSYFSLFPKFSFLDGAWEFLDLFFIFRGLILCYKRVCCLASIRSSMKHVKPWTTSNTSEFTLMLITWSTIQNKL